MVLLDELLRMRAALCRHTCDVLYTAQVYDELLVEIVLRGRPRIQTFFVRKRFGLLVVKDWFHVSFKIRFRSILSFIL